MIIAQGELEAQ